jgi:hypothetical protein
VDSEEEEEDDDDDEPQQHQALAVVAAMAAALANGADSSSVGLHTSSASSFLDYDVTQEAQILAQLAGSNGQSSGISTSEASTAAALVKIAGIGSR